MKTCCYVLLNNVGEQDTNRLCTVDICTVALKLHLQTPFVCDNQSLYTYTCTCIYTYMYIESVLHSLTHTHSLTHPPTHSHTNLSYLSVCSSDRLQPLHLLPSLCNGHLEFHQLRGPLACIFLQEDLRSVVLADDSDSVFVERLKLVIHLVLQNGVLVKVALKHVVSVHLIGRREGSCDLMLVSHDYKGGSYDLMLVSHDYKGGSCDLMQVSHDYKGGSCDLMQLSHDYKGGIM